MGCALPIACTATFGQLVNVSPLLSPTSTNMHWQRHSPVDEYALAEALSVPGLFLLRTRGNLVGGRAGWAIDSVALHMRDEGLGGPFAEGPPQKEARAGDSAGYCQGRPEVSSRVVPGFSNGARSKFDYVRYYGIG